MAKEPVKPFVTLSDKLQGVNDEVAIEDILNKLIEPGETIQEIALKTDLPNVMNVVKLQAFAEWMRMEGQEPSAKLLDKFVKNYMDDMVSDHRKGRTEIVKAVQAVKEMGERSKWTGKELDE